MPKASKKSGGKGKVYALPTAQRQRKDGGVPKFQQLKDKKQAMPYGKSKPVQSGPSLGARSIASLASTSNHLGNEFAASSAAASLASSSQLNAAPVDASLTVRDSSAKAFMRELRKVVERSDVVIQVLDARDPDGTRSRWVEEEVRKRDKKLLAVVNKIDLVPRANLEAWLKFLRHSFPCMPFKSSTQSQRQHLSQNAVPLVPSAPAAANTAAGIQQAPKLQELPTTSSSLGAPALLGLLKQYALSTPHSSLTVGVVGYPNVGKSSLINSLKRSRACGVAAMPGKTRVVQEVVLDKGVKILDCPGVVLEDFGRELDGDEGRRRQAEIMLRNCVKAELVEDPTAPVGVILDRAEPALLQKLYNIPEYSDVRDFLIKIALTRGRLGKGGIPDLDGSAVSVLRDWNSGKIPYYTRPPAFHPSSAPAPVVEGADDVAMEGEQVGDAKILNTLSEAFTLDGLFDNLGDEAAWEGEDDGVGNGAAWEHEEAANGEAAAMLEDPELVDVDAGIPTTRPLSTFNNNPYSIPLSPSSDVSSPPSSPRALPMPVPRFPAPVSTASTGLLVPLVPRGPASHPSKLFTPEELAMLPTDSMFDRQRLKQQAKKAKKRRAAAERTEGELLLGFMGMDVDVDNNAGNDGPETLPRPSAKRARQEKKQKAAAAAAVKAARATAPTATPSVAPDGDVDEQKEADFANFLANMGADDSDEEL